MCTNILLVINHLVRKKLNYFERVKIYILLICVAEYLILLFFKYKVFRQVYFHKFICTLC